MAKSSVLGKRSRLAEESIELPPTRRQRVTRRTAKHNGLAIFEDESASQIHQDGGEDLILVPSTPTRKAGRRTIPRKHKVCSEIPVPAQVQLGEVDENSQPLTYTLEKTHLRTPQTPRHKDALSTTVTPRHRVQIKGRLPLTPQTPRTPSSGPTTLYNLARQLFVRSARPDQLIGREDEVSQLKAFLNKGVSSRSGRAIYISGPPGTGKSAFVGKVVDGFKEAVGVQTTYVNCMSIKSTKELCTALIQNLTTTDNMKDTIEALKDIFYPAKANSKPIYVVTLDEIDHLLTLDHELLYSLFEWSLNKSSRLILIGIANALDLTDRFLPRLKSRNLKPQLLPFVPYTAPQIVSVVTSRLKTLSYDQSYVPFIHPSAIQFCAKKVASQTGDLRKAFDLIRRLIDVVETETRAKQVLQTEDGGSPLSENPNLSSPSLTSSKRRAAEDPLSHLTPETAPRANVAHAARIAAAAFNNGTSQRLKTLNVQQKAALCALLSLEKRKAAALKAREFQTPSKELRELPNIRKLHEVYGQLCRREGTLAPLERGEFGEVVQSLEGLGLVRPAEVPRAKAAIAMELGGRQEMGIASAVSEKELEAVLEGAVGSLLRGLLAGDD